MYFIKLELCLNKQSCNSFVRSAYIFTTCICRLHTVQQLASVYCLCKQKQITWTCYQQCTVIYLYRDLIPERPSVSSSSSQTTHQEKMTKREIIAPGEKTPAYLALVSLFPQAFLHKKIAKAVITRSAYALCCHDFWAWL